ncbi:MAG: MBL fold metallo-hydrolase, partial [Actinomycetota bacterium]|nr:MBL fold metallo-hydrolase [Actinomycetota bacterium]
PARRVVLASTAALAALLALPLVHSPGAGSADTPGNLTIRVMDVGQGDAILLDPPGGAPILVDSGPSQAHVAARLRELRAGALAALVVTHDQSDHAGGVAELIRSNHPGHLVLAAGSPRLAALAGAGGPDLTRLGEGGELRSAELRLSVLWPPRELLGMRGEDPNQLSLVLLAEWRHFSMLLTADAEAELARIDPGPVDVLKVAHHGSGDAGLDALLAQAAPRLAVISVGENSYGHPAAQTLSDLAEHDVPVARTDRDGEIVIEVDPAGWRVGQ